AWDTTPYQRGTDLLFSMRGLFSGGTTALLISTLPKSRGRGTLGFMINIDRTGRATPDVRDQCFRHNLDTLIFAITEGVSFGQNDPRIVSLRTKRTLEPEFDEAEDF